MQTIFISLNNVKLPSCKRVLGHKSMETIQQRNEDVIVIIIKKKSTMF